MVASVESFLTGGTTATVAMNSVMNLACACVGTCGGHMTLRWDGHETAQLLVSGETAPLLVSGETVPLLVSGETAQLLVSGETAQLLVSGETAQLLVSGETAQLLVSGETAQLLVSGECCAIGRSAVCAIRGRGSCSRVNTRTGRLAALETPLDSCERCDDVHGVKGGAGVGVNGVERGEWRE
jgi:hypothetical protein